MLRGVLGRIGGLVAVVDADFGAGVGERRAEAAEDGTGLVGVCWEAGRDIPRPESGVPVIAVGGRGDWTGILRGIRGDGLLLPLVALSPSGVGGRWRFIARISSIFMCAFLSSFLHNFRSALRRIMSVEAT